MKNVVTRVTTWSIKSGVIIHWCVSVSFSNLSISQTSSTNQSKEQESSTDDYCSNTTTSDTSNQSSRYTTEVKDITRSSWVFTFASMLQFLSLVIVKSLVPVWITSAFSAIVTFGSVANNRFVLATNESITEWDHTVVQFGTIVEESSVWGELTS